MIKRRTIHYHDLINPVLKDLYTVMQDNSGLSLLVITTVNLFPCLSILITELNSE